MTTKNDMFLIDLESADQIASGQRIYLQAKSSNYKVGVYTQVNPQPGKSISQDHANLISYGDFVGFENPSITINGTIDLKQFDASTGAEPTTTYNDGSVQDAKIITLRLLQQIYKSGHVFSLTDWYDFNEATNVPTTPISRIHSLTGTFPNETITTYPKSGGTAMKVRCVGVSVNFDTEISESEKVDYTLELVEVRG